MPLPHIQKRSLRRQVRTSILGIPPEMRRAYDKELAGQLSVTPSLREARRVMLYMAAFPEEIDTRPVIRTCLARKQEVILPRVDAARSRLVLHLVADLETDLKPGTLNILEPRNDLPEVAAASVMWILVPGLAFDENCFRLGRGGGYYDRLLPQLAPTTPKWSFAYDEQWVPTLPNEPHDQPVDAVLTPTRLIRRANIARPFS